MMRKAVRLMVMLALVYQSGRAIAQSEYPVSYELPEQLSAAPGGTFSLRASFDVPAPWYIYAPTGNNAAQGMVETNITYQLPDGFSRAGKMQLPKVGFHGGFEVFEGKGLVFEQTFEVSKNLQMGDYTIHLKITYQTCNEKVCLPPRTEEKDVLVKVSPADTDSTAIKLQFTALDGRKVDLAALKGKLVLIDCWATWCRPCIAEFDNLKKLYDKYHKQGFEVIGVSADVASAKPRVLQLIKEHALPWPQRFEGLGFDKDAFLQANGVKALPTVFLIDKNGKIVDRDARGEKLEGLIQTYLK